MVLSPTDNKKRPPAASYDATRRFSLFIVAIKFYKLLLRWCRNGVNYKFINLYPLTYPLFQDNISYIAVADEKDFMHK